ncbi:MAG: FkbM family methyltransferase [Actinomycetes bacterium]
MTDFRETVAGRRQSWYGTKRYTKRLLAARVPHALMRQGLELKPSLKSSRLPAPAHVREVVGEVGDAEFVMLRPDRCEIAKELYWGNGRRPGPADDLAIQLFGLKARSADLVLDIGAYTGLFTLVSAVSNPTAQVHAFEIVPEVFKALFDNCVRNDVLPQVTLHHTGVGEEGRVLLVPPGTGGSALPSFYSAALHFSTGVRVGMVSLDSLRPLIPAQGEVLIKIDVEGTEAALLQNGAQFLAASTPDMLCEVLPDVAEPRKLMEVLDPLGYEYHRLTDAGLVRQPTIVPDEGARDWFFTTKPVSGLPIPQTG